MIKPGFIRGLYPVLSDSHLDVAGIVDAANALKPHVSLMQLRIKKTADRDLAPLFRQLAYVLGSWEGLFVINDRPDLAVMADDILPCEIGLHLGQLDLLPSDARKIVGDEMPIGLSTHNADQFAEALRKRIDYIAIGPVFATHTKEDADPVVGAELVAELYPQAEIPVVAIGGLNATNLSQVRADAHAVVSALFGDAPVAEAVQQLKAALPRTP